MEEFIIFVRNKPHQLTRVCEMLSKHDVNIESVASEVKGENAIIKIVTNDPTKGKKALRDAGIPFETKEILVVDLPNRPGELSRFTKKIGLANLNIESIYMIGNERLGSRKLAIRFNDMKKAKEILRENLSS